MKYVIRILVFILFIGSSLQCAAIPVAHSESAKKNALKTPEMTVAQMSDEQARRVLIDELKEDIKKELSSEKANSNKSSLVQFINTIRDKVTVVQERIEFLKSSSQDGSIGIKDFLAQFSRKEDQANPLKTIFNIIIVFVAAFGIELLFYWYAFPLKQRMLKDAPKVLSRKIGRQFFKSVLDLFSLFIFIVAAIVMFYFFFHGNQHLRAPIAAYLSAIGVVKLVMIIARFFLSPKDPSSRFLPLTDATATYLHQWIRIITIISSFGLLTCGLIKLAGASDADHMKAVLSITLLNAGLLIIMILMRKKPVADHLSKGVDPDSPRWKISQNWHHFAVLGVIILLFASAGNVFLGNSNEMRALKTLAMIPFYFLVDWILRLILDSLFGLIPEDANHTNDDDKSQIEKQSENSQDENTSIIKKVEFDKAKQPIIVSIRISLIALFVVWTFNIWGLELVIGKAIAKAAFNILIVVLLCYIVWELLNTAIQRRIRLEMPDDDQEMEEGGAGGSRLGTLLLLLRKFLIISIITIATMIVLSSIGVDIGPLIAGAGVIGLAIGFGAQTLVKDIISGVFFLLDDAFRVGDFIRVGTTKGMVEQISIRSFKLRHPRGMVNTIPFGSIGTITNFSRDYIITKLDFRVRYDTDIQKVRKIIKKKVYKVILKDEELGPKLLGKIKSQGVRQLEDSAMIMRVKFKTIPGEQFGIRKEVFRLMQQAFKEEGIEFAHKNVTVYIPPDSGQSNDPADTDAIKKQVAAAAALAAEEPPASKN